MAFNTKTPQNIYGPYKQTLFLGCSVMSFSASAGHNEQQSELTVQLVQDPKAGSKTYYDQSLNKQTWTGPDPGIYYYGESGPVVGCPVYFRVADFEFSGLLQSWVESNSASGSPTYTVKIVDPRTILQGTELIVDNYAGDVKNVYNLINCYGHAESQGESCSNSLAGGYGGAHILNNGMPWNIILSSVKRLTSSLPIQANQFSPYGRLVHKGSAYSGFGVLGYDFFSAADITWSHNQAVYHDGALSTYLLDLSEVPTAPDTWRLPGPSINLMEAISHICGDAGCDYYIELVPVKYSSIVHKIIKIRTISRVRQPSLTAIRDFVGGREGVINNNHGVEARTEPTSSFIVGGKKAGIIEVTNVIDSQENGDLSNDYITPYWGVDSNNFAIKTYADTEDDKLGVRFYAPISDLNRMLQTPIQGQVSGHAGELLITEVELRAAAMGYDSWLSFASSVGGGDGTDAVKALQAANVDKPELLGLFGGEAICKLIAANQVGQKNGILPTDMMNLNVPKLTPDIRDREFDRDIHSVFDFIANYATTYYGKQFLVKSGTTCMRQDDDTGRLVTSEVPTESGWSDATTILGLDHPSVATDFLGTEDGRVGAFFVFDDADSKEYSTLDNNEYLIKETPANSGIYKLYFKARIDREYVWMDDGSDVGSPRCLMSIPTTIGPNLSALQLIPEETLAITLRLVLQTAAKRANKEPSQLETDLQTNEAWAKATAKSLITQSIQHAASMPGYAAVPLQSNVLTYGPWGVKGPAGPVKVEVDEGLVPWEFGSTANMNDYGTSKAQQALTGMQAGETGEITIPGYPTIPLTAELGATFGSAGSQLVENRVAVLDSEDILSTNIGQWTGLYGPNVTSISVQVATGGVQTTYSMRTFTPQFGRFAKVNADRLKKLAKLNLARQKQTRLLEFKTADVVNRFAKHGVKIKDLSDITQGFAYARKQSPHNYIVGNIVGPLQGDATGITGFRRTSVSLESFSDVVLECAEAYNEKAIMSLDGLFRPVSLNGDADLPRFADNGANTSGTGAFTLPSMPPLRYPTGVASYGSGMNQVLGIDGHSLNPLQSGHDIDIIARSGTLPSGHLSFPVDAGSGNIDYPSDYRFLAHKGPLVIHGWGYDTEGKPIPNAADNPSNAADGSFETTGLKDEFLSDWLKRPQTWPVAPVDLRYDRNRHVWTAPPPHQLVVGTIINDNNYDNSGFMTGALITGRQVFSPSGSGATPNSSGTGDAPTFLVRNILENGSGNSLSGFTPVKSGDKFIAYYNTDTSEYNILEYQKKVVKSYDWPIVLYGGTGNLSISGSTIDEWVSASDGKFMLKQPGFYCIEICGKVGVSGSGGYADSVTGIPDIAYISGYDNGMWVDSAYNTTGIRNAILDYFKHIPVPATGVHVDVRVEHSGSMTDIVHDIVTINPMCLPNESCLAPGAMNYSKHFLLGVSYTGSYLYLTGFPGSLPYISNIASGAVCKFDNSTTTGTLRLTILSPFMN